MTLLILALHPAAAYETDQLTNRAAPLVDALDAANHQINTLLAEAVVETNRETRCALADRPTRQILARHIYRLTSRSTYVPGRKGLEGFGYGAYSAWLETAEIDRRTFPDRTDIYASIDARESFILANAGVCATIQLGGVLLGTDKIDHFLGEGYAYAVASRWGKRPERAIRWGTRTELSFFGLLTSNTFAFADLRANWDGYQFYTGLLGSESVMRRGADGCVQQVRPFDWTEWIDTEYDEVLNPGVYTAEVALEVAAHLVSNRERYCEGYAEWGRGLSERVATVIREPMPYAGSKAPARTDPFRLHSLCGSVSPPPSYPPPDPSAPR